MYIRKVTHTDKKNLKEYYTYKLVESIRTERGPRQRTLLNLGADFTLPEKDLKRPGKLHRGDHYRSTASLYLFGRDRNICPLICSEGYSLSRRVC
jgi:hypothetical protein